MIAILIPRRVLIAAGSLSPALAPARVTGAIARGLREGGLADPDQCPLEHDLTLGPRELLDELGFDARMRASRAVIIAAERLSEQALAASVTFEIATRARQSGVPAYAITAGNELDRFDARVLDLQAILIAGDERALLAAGRRLAQLI